ncbi:hypothetical protein ACLCDV_10530 [Sphingobacterium sp. Lzh-3]|uniref:hypothetical protein n=1 Tax=Sphingobacterium sp. Lzh-3 TaxID=3382150 RepID=UPI00398CAD34
MKRINVFDKTVYGVTIGLLPLLFVLFYSSCISISPKYLAKNANDHSVSQIGLKEVYVFDNFPQKVPGRNDGSQEKSSKYNKVCLWNFIEPDYYKTDSLQYLYKTSLELTRKNKMLFKLIDTLGNVVREKTRKVKSEPSNFFSIRNTDIDIYVLLNRFSTTSICLAVDKNGDLIVPSEWAGGGFFILFPLAGNHEYAYYSYRRIVTVIHEPNSLDTKISVDSKAEFSEVYNCVPLRCFE